MSTGQTDDHVLPSTVRDVIVQDAVAIRSWNTVKDHFLSVATVIATVASLLASLNFDEAILLTLDTWSSEQAANATISKCAEILRTNNLVRLADGLLERFGEDKLIMDPIKYPDLFTNAMRDLALQSKDKSIAILELPPNDTVRINQDAFNSVLETVGDKPLVIAAIKGRFRNGKSFMMNNFIKYLEFGGQTNDWISQKLSNQFEWRGGLERVTRGIQMWSKVYTRDVRGREVTIVLMDTQGLFDDQTTDKGNATIFAFSALLSSIGIFNTKEVGTDVLQSLQMYLEYAKMALDNPGTNGKAFQKLIVLLRDWANADTHGWGSHTDTNCPPNFDNQHRNLKKHLLEEKLGKMTEQTQAARQTIKSCFDEICVVALPSPGDAFVTYKKTDVASWSPDFKKHVVEFVEDLFSDDNLLRNIKRIGEEEVTAQALKGYISCWADLYSDSENLPSFKTVFEATAELQGKMKVEAGINHYIAGISKVVQDNADGITGPVFEAHHVRIRDECVANFTRTKGIGGQAVQAEFLRQLNSGIVLQYSQHSELNRTNLEKSAAKARAISLAQARLADANRALEKAKGHLQSLNTSLPQFYDIQEKPVKHRNRLLGVVVSPSYSTNSVTVFNQGRYNAAIAEAQREVDDAEVRKAEVAKELEALEGSAQKCSVA